MSYPPEKKLFIGNIKQLNIAALMNTVKLIDPYANFYPDANKKFGFIHMTTAERCNEIYEKLLNSTYNGRSIMVERPKGYVPPYVPKQPAIIVPIHSSVSNSVAWQKINPTNEFKAKMDARQKAINEAERVKATAYAEQLEIEQMNARRINTHIMDVKMLEAQMLESQRIEAQRIEAQRIEAQRIEAQRIEAQRIEAQRIEAQRIEANRLAYDIEIDRMLMEATDHELIDSFFAMPTYRRVILNPEEDCY